MAELIRVKCTGGDLVITDREIAIELKRPFGGGLIRRDSIIRAAITGQNAKTHVTNGFVDFTFSGAGKQLVAKLIKPADAQRVQAILDETPPA